MATEVKVKELPSCDIHRQNMGGEGPGPEVPAEYDGKTLFGPWAFMCAECFPLYGMGLGTGLGQRLIKEEKGSDDVTG